jgi:hypothetical protein
LPRNPISTLNGTPFRLVALLVVNENLLNLYTVPVAQVESIPSVAFESFENEELKSVPSVNLNVIVDVPSYPPTTVTFIIGTGKSSAEQVESKLAFSQ